ncbi:MAG TPA: GTPase, partial [Devosia sp.]
QWRDQLLDLRAEIEARLDFSGEGDVEEALPPHFDSQVADLKQDIDDALSSVNQGRIVREGIRVALAGPPNVGKSSLINALANSDIAIVSDEAGTTRDVRDVPLSINGQLYILQDLAGLRETDSKAEAEGIRRARLAMEQADLVLWLQAPDVPDIKRPQLSVPVLTIATKGDLKSLVADLTVSVRTRNGLDQLTNALQEFGEALGANEPVLLSRERDRQALAAAKAELDHVSKQLGTPELAAESLRRASNALERLVGRLDAERVLDRLFLSFCIGK